MRYPPSLLDEIRGRLSREPWLAEVRVHRELPAALGHAGCWLATEFVAGSPARAPTDRRRLLAAAARAGAPVSVSSAIPLAAPLVALLESVASDDPFAVDRAATAVVIETDAAFTARAVERREGDVKTVIKPVVFFRAQLERRRGQHRFNRGARRVA